LQKNKTPYFRGSGSITVIYVDTTKQFVISCC